MAKKFKVDTLKIKLYDESGVIFKDNAPDIEKIKKKFNFFLKEKYGRD